MADLITKDKDRHNAGAQREQSPAEHASYNDKANSSISSDRDASRQAAQKDYPQDRLQPSARVTQYARKVKVKRVELMLFTSQLSVMLDSGVMLSDALSVISEQSYQTSPNLSRVITEVSELVKGGENFSVALAYYPKVFNSMFIGMVRASEASGGMAEMLRVLCSYLEFESTTRRRIKGALTYPVIMLLMAVIATTTIMFCVLPKFMKIYASRQAALPKLTQMLVGLGNVLNDFESLTVIVTTLVVVSTGLYYWLGTPTGRRVKDYIKLRTPVIGTMFIDTVVTRSMRIMATMVSTGVGLLDAIEVIRNSCDNYYFQLLWDQTSEKIRDGYQLSESIQIAQDSKSVSFVGFRKGGMKLLSPGIIQMLRAGEKSGKLGDVSDKVSVFYERKLEGSIKSVTALIEPLMITVLGGIIGVIAIALLLPVFKISTIIAH